LGVRAGNVPYRATGCGDQGKNHDKAEREKGVTKFH